MFVQEQLVQTRAEVDAAEAALVEFESRNLAGVLRDGSMPIRAPTWATSRHSSPSTASSAISKACNARLEGTLRPAAEALSLADQLHAAAAPDQGLRCRGERPP